MTQAKVSLSVPASASPEVPPCWVHGYEHRPKSGPIRVSRKTSKNALPRAGKALCKTVQEGPRTELLSSDTAVIGLFLLAVEFSLLLQQSFFAEHWSLNKFTAPFNQFLAPAFFFPGDARSCTGKRAFFEPVLHKPGPVSNSA